MNENWLMKNTNRDDASLADQVQIRTFALQNNEWLSFKAVLRSDVNGWKRDDMGFSARWKGKKFTLFFSTTSAHKYLSSDV